MNKPMNGSVYVIADFYDYEQDAQEFYQELMQRIHEEMNDEDQGKC
jgi:ubiquitin C-terminal hydrolase